MFNTTGCPPAFAQDNFFIFGPGVIGECILAIPFHVTFYVLAALMQASVAIGRTRFILFRPRTRATKPTEQNQIGWRQWLTLFQCWGAFVNVVCILVVPLFVAIPPRNMMGILLGFVCLFYHISAQSWLYKLLRLGGRIIDPKQTQKDFQEMNKKLQTQDMVLQLITSSINVAIFIQLLFLLVLNPIFDTESRWILAGVGITAFTTFAGIIAHVYQYQRCKNAVMEINKRVRDAVVNGAGGESKNVMSVLTKFTRHQMILIVLGSPAVVLSLCWAFGAIPLNCYLLACFVFFDTGTNFSMFVTYIMKSNNNSSSSQQADARISSGKRADGKVAVTAAALTAAESSVGTSPNTVA